MIYTNLTDKQLKDIQDIDIDLYPYKDKDDITFDNLSLELKQKLVKSFVFQNKFKSFSNYFEYCKKRGFEIWKKL